MEGCLRRPFLSGTPQSFCFLASAARKLESCEFPDDGSARKWHHPHDSFHWSHHRTQKGNPVWGCGAQLQGGLQLLPPPFGPKTMVPNTVKLQMAIVEENDATVTIFKHYFFANKAKPSYVKSIACGWRIDKWYFTLMGQKRTSLLCPGSFTTMLCTRRSGSWSMLSRHGPCRMARKFW